MRSYSTHSTYYTKHLANLLTQKNRREVRRPKKSDFHEFLDTTTGTSALKVHIKFMSKCFTGKYVQVNMFSLGIKYLYHL